MNEIEIVAVSPLVGEGGVDGLIIRDASGEFTLLTGPGVQLILNMYQANGGEQKEAAKYTCTYCGKLSLSYGAAYSHAKVHDEVVDKPKLNTDFGKVG